MKHCSKLTFFSLCVPVCPIQVAPSLFLTHFNASMRVMYALLDFYKNPVK